MKNLIFIRYKNSKIGGAETYLQRISDNLNNATFQVLSSNAYKKNHSIIIKIPKFLPKSLKFLYFLNKYESYKKKHKDFLYFSLERVLHCDIYRAGDGIHKQWLNIKANTFFKKIKSYFNPMNLIYLAIEPRLLNNTKIIITNSKMIKNAIIETYNISENKIKVIYNGVKKPEIINKENAREKLFMQFPALSTKHPIITFVGSGYARKGLKEALEILMRIPHKNWIFLVIGKEKNIKKYKNFTKKLGLQDNIFFLDSQNNVELFLEASDIFLFPTHYEPCSNATLEAASFQNAVITTKQNGASELLDSKLILNNPYDFSYGSEILSKLLKDSDFLKKSQQICSKNIPTLQENIQKTLEVIHHAF